MPLRKNLVCLLSFAGMLLASSAAIAAQHSPQVVGWVPAYAVQDSLAALDSEPLIGKTLTRIGLQFWNPSADGRSMVRAPVDASGTPVSEQAIRRVRDWAHQRDIQVLLTVYNNSETTKTWDWAWAKRAFDTRRDEFIDALVTAMQRYRLDGIDVDLEGNGGLDADRAAYARFIRQLAEAVHAKGKIVTVDSFHSPCWNAPNMSWWSDWAGHIDGLHVMGYQDLYEASEETFQPDGQPVCEDGQHIFKYSWQVAWGLQAGYRADQIAMGQPTWVDHWGQAEHETSAAAHIREVQALGAGICLWDLQLPTPGWREQATWQTALNLRQHPGEGWKRLPATDAHAPAAPVDVSSGRQSSPRGK